MTKWRRDAGPAKYQRASRWPSPMTKWRRDPGPANCQRVSRWPGPMGKWRRKFKTGVKTKVENGYPHEEEEEP